MRQIEEEEGKKKSPLILVARSINVHEGGASVTTEKMHKRRELNLFALCKTRMKGKVNLYLEGQVDNYISDIF